MYVGVIDVGEWQSRVDLSTGQPVEVDHPLVVAAGGVCSGHPYPGDFAPNNSAWVTDVALDLASRHDPQFVMLDYASAFFISAFQPSTDDEVARSLDQVFGEVYRFIDRSGFEPIVVGLGDLVPLSGHVDLTDLDCLVLAGGMSARHAGLYGASDRDLTRLAEREGVERIDSRESFRVEFGGDPSFYARFPDHLVTAREGYSFRGLGSGARPVHRLPAHDAFIPLLTSLGKADSVVGVADLALQALGSGRRVALILVEAAGCRTFPRSHVPISNSLRWFTYSAGSDQYLALTTGKHLVERPYPPGYHYYSGDTADKRFPFSAMFDEISADTIGSRWTGRGIAVGNRSIMTHVSAGTDIAVECFARGLYNHGVMAAVRIDGAR